MGHIDPHRRFLWYYGTSLNIQLTVRLRVDKRSADNCTRCTPTRCALISIVYCRQKGYHNQVPVMQRLYKTTRKVPATQDQKIYRRGARNYKSVPPDQVGTNQICFVRIVMTLQIIPGIGSVSSTSAPKGIVVAVSSIHQAASGSLRCRVRFH